MGKCPEQAKFKGYLPNGQDGIQIFFESCNQWVDHYWNAIFLLESVDGKSQYQCMPLVIKSGLVFAQTNGESERSLSINARVVTSERSVLGEVTITGLCTVKEAVRFYDPVNGQPVNIVITRELKRSV